jgi:hypothetical protein
MSAAPRGGGGQTFSGGGQAGGGGVAVAPRAGGQAFSGGAQVGGGGVAVAPRPGWAGRHHRRHGGVAFGFAAPYYYDDAYYDYATPYVVEDCYRVRRVRTARGWEYRRINICD